jgi:hypothetical protein
MIIRDPRRLFRRYWARRRMALACDGCQNKARSMLTRWTRDGDAAMEFIDDLASRLANRVQPTTDGHKSYLYAADAAFGGEVDLRNW